MLLTAWRGQAHEAALAMSLMEDPRRTFFSSPLVRLELLPKALFHRQKDEVAFYKLYFQTVRGEEPLSPQLAESAMLLSQTHGIAAMDALHLASALRQGVEEFITSEKPGKPLFKVSNIRVISLYDLAKN
ncbi:MAG: type II toxin-antitoxin system VapC family toxin [Blastochloris sp.]|nr:type II toxin-antitoxin system VapC family toxin [Blastochloris sp.]